MSNAASNTPAPRRSFLPFALGLPVAFACIALILLVFQYRQVKTLVADQPAPLPHLALSQEAQSEVLDRVKAFLEPRDTSRLASDTLRLNEDEVNHLIRWSPYIAQDALTYHLALKESTAILINVMPSKNLKGPVAWMVKWLRPDGWLNSTMEAKADIAKGRIQVVLVSATMNGVSTPVGAFNRDNRLDPHRMVADTAAFNRAVEKLGALRIEGGALILVRRVNAP